MISNDDLEILKQYNAEVMGMYNYYKIAHNVSVLGHFNYVMKFSMFKTFGAKYKMRIGKVRKKYGYKDFGVTYKTKKDTKILYYYNKGFKYDSKCINKADVDIIPKVYRNNNPTSLITRLKVRKCEYCNAENVKIEIHHIKKLKDLKGKKKWEKLMIARKRKTLALCVKCHDDLHGGKLD